MNFPEFSYMVIDSRSYNGYPNVGIWHLIAIIENNDADTAGEAKKLAYQNTAQSRKKLLELVQKVAKEYIEANGIACLNQDDYEYVVNDLVERQGRIKEYEREQEEKRNLEFMSDWEDTPTTTVPEPTMQEKLQALQRLYKINKNPEIKGYVDAFKRLIKLKI
jgi:hypothetical protein